MNRYILAHDLGTSGDKATLFKEDGALLLSRTTAYDTHYFNGTWVEQNAEDWWKAVCTSSRDLITASGIAPEDIAAVSFSGQMMGCLCVDKQGTPLRPSIIWADSRAVTESARLEESISQWDFYHIVGHRNTPSYGLQKLMWVRDHEPDIYEQTYKVLNAKDYIVFKLTGQFYTEYSDGNSMGCFDLNRLEWSEQILSYAGISIDKFPVLKPSTFIAGHVTAEAAALTGIAEGTPVVLGGGDGVMANIGAGSVEPGKTYCCLGTSAWVTTTTEKPIFDDDMRTVTWAHAIPGLYAPNGTMQYAGGSYSWLKKTVCHFETEAAGKTGKSPYTLMDQEIAVSPIGSHGAVFLPYMLGERAPRWDLTAKGAWLGLTPECTRGDLLRSVLEGCTMNLAIILDILRTQVEINKILVIGGGARSQSWLRIMADVFAAEILVPSLLEEANSMGTAVTGGVGVGLYKDFNAIDQFINIENSLLPDPSHTESYAPVRERFDRYYYALKGVE